MVCTYCGHDTQVVNSRHQKRLNQVWRRRKCTNCGAVFSTHEAADYEASWRVLDTNGSLHPFLRDKLLISLHKSLEHRPTAVADASGLLNTIVSLLRPLAAKGTLEASEIALTTREVLIKFDNAAATHYAAFHKLS